VRVVDCHVHLHSRTFHEAHVERSEPPVAERRGGGYLFRASDGDALEVPERFFDVERQLAELGEQGVDTAVSGVDALSLDHLPLRQAVELAMHLNEERAELERRFPGRVYALALLPMQDAQAAIQTLEHAIRALALRGVAVAPGDEAGSAARPVFQRIAELGVPVFLNHRPRELVDRLLEENPSLTVVHGPESDGLPCHVASAANAPGRLLFASGYPYASAAEALAAIRGRLDGPELDAALSGNAASMLGLG
jgi:predicted TIM-barrel fold metal-dependent hydrolase